MRPGNASNRPKWLAALLGAGGLAIPVVITAAAAAEGWEFALAFIFVQIAALPAIVLGGAAMALWLLSPWVKPRDPGACRKCGYDLRGLPGNTCPECGSSTTTVDAP